MVLPVAILAGCRSVHRSAVPPRRAAARVVANTPAPAPPRRIRRLPASPDPSPAHTVISAPARPSVSEQDRFNAPLYTFKAFAIATAIVMSSATAAVAGLIAYLNVSDTAEFAAHMRTWVSQSMPLLTAKIYRRPTSHDPADGDPVLPTATTPRHECSTPTAFDHDAAQQRLADAFDKGGFDMWAEAAVREMEAEIEVERSKRTT